MWIASENAEVLLQHADDDAAEQVDRDDDHAGDGVALDELRGAVHRAVEVGLARDLGAAVRACVLGDLAGVQVGVDRHLLARHRVEGEARGDLGDAAGAVRDHDELDHDEDQEDDEADDEVAADDEVPNAWMTLPASPWLRMRRVTLTLIASRNSVVRRSSDGNAAKSSARFTYMLAAMIDQRAGDVQRDHAG